MNEELIMKILKLKERIDSLKNPRNGKERQFIVN